VPSSVPSQVSVVVEARAVSENTRTRLPTAFCTGLFSSLTAGCCDMTWRAALVLVLAFIGAARAHEEAAEEALDVGQATSQDPSLRPFHLAIPVHSIEAAREFYGGRLGLTEGRSSDRWVDWNLYGSQLVTHLVGPDYRGRDFFNSVDSDDVPVPHFGAVLTLPEFHELRAKLESDKKFEFVLAPHVRFQDKPGEQWTMFFKVGLVVVVVVVFGD
jgi:uncharacterized protein